MSPTPEFYHRDPNRASLLDLARVFGSAGGQLAQLLYPLAWEDFVFEKDDFVVSTLNSDMWTLAVDGGTTFAIPGTRIVGGAVSGATGVADNDGLSIRLNSAILTGNRGGGMACRFRSDTVSGFQFEIGLTDTLTDFTLPGVTDIDTPAVGNGSTNLAAVHMDTDQTLTTMSFASYDGTTAAKDDLGTLTPTAATWMTVIVQMIGTTPICIIDRAQEGSAGFGVLNAGISQTALMLPYAYFRTRNTTTKNIDIDYIAFWQERDA